MKKQRTSVAVCSEPTLRMTRSRTAASQTSSYVPDLSRPHNTKPENLTNQGTKSKTSSITTILRGKRKAPLGDLTNVVAIKNANKCTEISRLPLTKPNTKINQMRKSNIPFMCKSDANVLAAARNLPSKRKASLVDITHSDFQNATKNCNSQAIFQPKKFLKIKLDSSKTNSTTTTNDPKLAVVVIAEKTLAEKDENDKINEATKIKETSRFQDETLVEEGVKFLGQQDSEYVQTMDNTVKPEVDGQEMNIECNFIDIDSDHANPQMCSLYAADIYANLHAHELDHRPSTNFMETIQHDITQSMRAILIDWLVEVADEYKLVPDTLYLTVRMLDRFLSQNFIERQNLQLLGITCMLIASKYEEIMAPRIEEFCFITDNTYKSEDVRGMEKKVLNCLGFKLSVPTVKTFLRRFLRAAQTSYKVPTLVLEFFANYLVELTLIEYSFLRFIPSIVAASAVFLARWTLDQSGHPWNSTLEHYTCYKASELKTVVLAIHDLKKNTESCPLHAIREKYMQGKYKSVANMVLPEKLIPAVFGEDYTCSFEIGGADSL